MIVIMTFLESLSEWLKNWFQIKGRLGRLEYASTQVVNFWLMIAMMALLSALGIENNPLGMLGVVALGVTAVILTVIKRYTDMGEPLSHIIKGLIPVVCVYYWLEVFWRPGDQAMDASETLPAQRFSRTWQGFHIGVIVLGFGFPVLWVFTH